MKKELIPDGGGVVVVVVVVDSDVIKSQTPLFIL